VASTRLKKIVTIALCAVAALWLFLTVGRVILTLLFGP
jgi:hypothetical protein